MALAALRFTTSSNFVGCSTGSLAGSAPLDDLVDEGGGTSPRLDGVGAVAHQPARLDLRPERIHGGETTLGRQLGEAARLREEVATHEHAKSQRRRE